MASEKLTLVETELPRDDIGLLIRVVDFANRPYADFDAILMADAVQDPRITLSPPRVEPYEGALYLAFHLAFGERTIVYNKAATLLSRGIAQVALDATFSACVIPYGQLNPESGTLETSFAYSQYDDITRGLEKALEDVRLQPDAAKYSIST